MLNFFRHSSEIYDETRTRFHRPENSLMATYPAVAITPTGTAVANLTAVGSSDHALFGKVTAAESSRTIVDNVPEVGYPAITTAYDTGARLSGVFHQPFCKREEHLHSAKIEKVKRRGTQSRTRTSPFGSPRKRVSRSQTHQSVNDWNFSKVGLYLYLFHLYIYIFIGPRFNLFYSYKVLFAYYARSVSETT